mgnify:CR=1 FL=1
MRRQQPTQYLPSHKWLFLNKFRDIVAYIAISFFIFTLLAGMVIRYAVERDCQNPYARDLKIGHYWININVGSTKKGCPVYETEL